MMASKETVVDRLGRFVMWAIVNVLLLIPGVKGTLKDLGEFAESLSRTRDSRPRS